MATVRECKVAKIRGARVVLAATAAIPRVYRDAFHEDWFQDIAFLEDACRTAHEKNNGELVMNDKLACVLERVLYTVIRADQSDFSASAMKSWLTCYDANELYPLISLAVELWTGRKTPAVRVCLVEKRAPQKFLRDVRICFTGTANGTEAFVNIATYLMPDGREIVVDRDETDFSVEEDGTMTMEWIGCYIWDGEHAEYKFPEDFKDAEFLGVEVEDDAPEGYVLEVHDASASYIE